MCSTPEDKGPQHICWSLRLSQEVLQWAHWGIYVYTGWCHLLNTLCKAMWHEGLMPYVLIEAEALFSILHQQCGRRPSLLHVFSTSYFTFLANHCFTNFTYLSWFWFWCFGTLVLISLDMVFRVSQVFLYTHTQSPIWVVRFGQEWIVHMYTVVVLSLTVEVKNSYYLTMLQCNVIVQCICHSYTCDDTGHTNQLC